jgi:hypothetical protein
MKARVSTLFAGFLLLAARAASAQSTDPYFTDFSAQYDVVYHEEDVTSHAGAHFDFASTFKRSVPYMGPVVEVGFNHFDDATISSVMGGVRLRIPNEDWRVLPFGQVLVGLYHCGICDVNDFALQAGGGLDFGMRKNNFRIRTQVDVRRVFDQAIAFNAVRFSVGIVLPLNK